MRIHDNPQNLCKWKGGPRFNSSLKTNQVSFSNIKFEFFSSAFSSFLSSIVALIEFLEVLLIAPYLFHIFLISKGHSSSLISEFWIAKKVER